MAETPTGSATPCEGGGVRPDRHLYAGHAGRKTILELLSRRRGIHFARVDGGRVKRAIQLARAVVGHRTKHRAGGVSSVAGERQIFLDQPLRQHMDGNEPDLNRDKDFAPCFWSRLRPCDSLLEQA